METTERIVEAYVRHVKGWATIPNIRCAKQNEIDLVAIDAVSLSRYHIEVSISISQGFRNLTAMPFDAEKMKDRGQQPTQRRTVGFFAERKFNAPTVVDRLRQFGFEPDGYTRIIVTWGWTEDAAKEAMDAKIELWDFRNIIRELAEAIRGSHEYFTDDTLRTLNLFIHASDEADQNEHRETAEQHKPSHSAPVRAANEQFWVYENWTNQCATLHRETCSFCNDGRGMHGKSATSSGQWLGPFTDEAKAWERAKDTHRRDIRRCGICLPMTSPSPAIPNIRSRSNG
ncbi:hypothetical protein JCM17846_26130 [Iodidimonas nitroreducens]|uniref:Uncharacterized protein n=1 Tax=Iodidimonas nitroreducens TaxID=1236968 RepID=A0A5A7N9B4_9PROT|nr:hypothetical protein [Iodidimonas nitroreducens]GAK32730.1 hypothetical protein AQ1_00599 [alpha proteobacterium Q-1]GER04931.1 hypothetical protein JCM17846_26130 [Iodidimonas nitroreducens]